MGAGPVPTDRDADATLARHGVRPGPEGHDPAALAAAIEARGWAWSAEPTAGELGLGATGRWRALGFAAGDTDPTAGSHALGSRSARATGTTEGEALARALAKMLGRGEAAG